MGKASSNKKVSRAASTGGGRTRQTARPWGWYSALGVVVLLGVVLVITSRGARQDLAAEGRTIEPRVGLDHWHAAFGLYLCDAYAAPLPEPSPLPGLHTHGDEVIHVEPQRVAESGKKATLGTWAKENGLTLTPTKVAAGGRSFENGDDCGGKPGRVRVRVDDDVITYDPRDVLLKDGQRITVAFVTEGAEIPPLPESALTGLANNQAPEIPGAGGTVPLPPGVTTPGPAAGEGPDPGAPTTPAPGPDPATPTAGPVGSAPSTVVPATSAPATSAPSTSAPASTRP